MISHWLPIIFQFLQFLIINNIIMHMQMIQLKIINLTKLQQF
jgi:hypothetical protein